jgi:predicted porin
MYMNKKLLSLAVASVLAGLGGVAHADTTVYGKFHVSWDYDKSDTNTPPTSANPDQQSYVSDNSSRFGIKYSEDLGGGVSALGQWEIGARTDTASTLTTNRNSFVGLSSKAAGKVMLGKYDTPYKDAGRMVDLFNERVGDSRNVIGANLTTGTPAAATGFDRRVNNMVRYDSPTWAGVNFALLYSGGETVTNTSVGSAGVSWAGAGAKVTLAYESHATGLPAPSSETETGMRVAASYSIADFTVGGLYEQLSDIGGNTALSRNTYGLGGQYKMGNHIIKAQYYVADSVDTLTDSGASLWALGYDYNLSKNTLVYVAFAQASNDANVRGFGPASGNGGHGDVLTAANSATNNGVSPSAISTGMEIKF